MRKFVWVVVMGLVLGGAVEAKARSKIAFSSQTPGTGSTGYHIYVMDSDGSNITQLTNTERIDTKPMWSPDGSQISFVCKVSGESPQVCVMDADGSNVIQITNLGDLYDGSSPAWSPELPAQVSAISVGGTYALVFMMGVIAALMMVNRQDRRQGIEPGAPGL